MRTGAFFVLAFLGVAMAGSEPKTRERVRELESELGRAYFDLWGETHADADLLRAYELGSRDASGALEEQLGEACRREEWSRAQALIHASASRRPSDLERAKKAPVLRTARKHPMQYLLSLPSGWTPEKKWPVVLCVEGAGCVWMNMLGPWMAARGDEPFVLVTPLTTTNTSELDRLKYHYSDEVWAQIAGKGRLAFDLPGALAVIDEVVVDCSGEEKVYVTGFSGGGVLTWNLIFGHPEKLAAAAPVCANFFGVASVSDWEGREKLPVRAFQGGDDPVKAQLDPQWKAAKELARASGFEVKREIVPGARHETCARTVLKWVEEQRTK